MGSDDLLGVSEGFVFGFDEPYIRSEVTECSAFGMSRGSPIQVCLDCACGQLIAKDSYATAAKHTHVPQKREHRLRNANLVDVWAESLCEVFSERLCALKKNALPLRALSSHAACPPSPHQGSEFGRVQCREALGWPSILAAVPADPVDWDRKMIRWFVICFNVELELGPSNVKQICRYRALGDLEHPVFGTEAGDLSAALACVVVEDGESGESGRFWFWYRDAVIVLL